MLRNTAILDAFGDGLGLSPANLYLSFQIRPRSGHHNCTLSTVNCQLKKWGFMFNTSTLMKDLTSLLSQSLSLTVSADRADEECVTLRFCGGDYDEVFLDSGKKARIPLLLLSKSIDGEKALKELCKALDILEKQPPDGVMQVRPSSLPELVDRGEDGALYEAQAELFCYQTAEG